MAVDFVETTLSETKEDQLAGIQEPAQVRNAAAVLVVSAIMLVLREVQYRPELWDWFELLRDANYFGMAWLSDFETWLLNPANRRLSELGYWSLWQFGTYILVPMLFVKLVLREKLGDYGIKLKTAFSFWWIYVAMYLIILPCVLFVSSEDSFQSTYPFFRPDDVGEPNSQAYWNRFWIWECFYALQFVSLEFFFRGFMLHGTRRVLGVSSIFVMSIPYCMIHFGKPMPETLGAIIAGVVLGFMSLKTRSIWMGAATHISVALTMDFAALSVQP